MTTVDGVSRYCPAAIDLDARQLEFLACLPMPAHGLLERLDCELERGHSGFHAALGQHSFNTQWWVQWSLAASEINPLALCTAERFPGDEEEDDNGCVLFDRHEGRHSHIRGQFFG
ncbi:hypothetical protein [Actinoplanes sp. NPDC026619]|uniref:hypothetical protein n=1 Tax=Actinoplanes sp. NPDC026619 TaxID=3155798 RepID=UPI0033D0614B